MADWQTELKHPSNSWADKLCFRHRTKGKPCYRLNCPRPECRQARIWAEYTRLQLGFAHILEQGDRVWFITISLADPYKFTETDADIQEFQEMLSDFQKAYQALAKKNQIELLRATGRGRKSKYAAQPSQFHAHLMTNWVPSPVPEGTDGFHHSKPLEQIAQKLGFKVHIIKVNSRRGTIKYLIRNLKDLSDAQVWGKIDLPSGFNSINYSRNWPKMEYQQHRQQRRELKRMRSLLSQINATGLTLDELLIIAVIKAVIPDAFSDTPSRYSPTFAASHTSSRSPG